MLSADNVGMYASVSVYLGVMTLVFCRFIVLAVWAFCLNADGFFSVRKCLYSNLWFVIVVLLLFLKFHLFDFSYFLRSCNMTLMLLFTKYYHRRVDIVIVRVIGKSTLSLRFNGRYPAGPGLAGTRMYLFWILL